MHIARFWVIKHNGKHSLSASGQKHHANCYALCGYNLWFCNPIHVPMVLCWRKKMNTRKPVFEFGNPKFSGGSQKMKLNLGAAVFSQ